MDPTGPIAWPEAAVKVSYNVATTLIVLTCCYVVLRLIEILCAPPED